MKRLQRNARIAGLALILGSLALVAVPAAATHAAVTPAVTAYGKGGGVQVFGSGCTPGVQVRVELLTHDLSTVLVTEYLTAAGASSGDPGSIHTLITTAYVGNVYVAMDCQPGPTAWASVYVYPAPYIEVSGYTPANYPDPSNLYVNGSGFRPGSWVRVDVYVAGTSTVLGQQNVQAYSGTQSENGFIYAEFHIHYIGYVQVIAYAFPKSSNEVTFYEWAS